MSLNWLINALTIDGTRRKFMIGFDYNQTQNSSALLNCWALITVRDLDRGLSDVNYEVRSNPTNTPYNAQSTATTEIVACLPELSASLKFFRGLGYDSISVRMAFGCFGGTPAGSVQPGVDYLSNAGATSNCENGDFGDVVLMAGAAERSARIEPKVTEGRTSSGPRPLWPRPWRRCLDAAASQPWSAR